MNEARLVNYQLIFRQDANTKLLNKYICFDMNFPKLDNFWGKKQNSMAQLIFMAKQQIVLLESKFCWKLWSPPTAQDSKVSIIHTGN